ncbi:hypothetical protein HMPREF9555_01390 [Selenomonas artemidis F0399]|uniref:Uncharacterized protein n=1 Tax=Selenomonas artemidis F0399 TaxID=749551 RepID=E7N318_9FIRM|nr:hypothetical protein HMPREF9555_01390 [Selenomonas artemidis F0399]
MQEAIFIPVEAFAQCAFELGENYGILLYDISCCGRELFCVLS